VTHDHILRRLNEEDQDGRAQEKVEKALKLLREAADEMHGGAAGNIGSACRDIEEILRAVG
jgi:hypothetical protein